MLEEFSTGEFLAGIAYLIVAARLLRRGLRNGEVPERLLGGAFFFYGVSSVIYAMGTVPQFGSMVTALNFAGRVVYFPTPLMVAMFTRLAASLILWCTTRGTIRPRSTCST